MTTIAELMELAEIPMMDDYGDPATPQDCKRTSVRVKRELVDATDLEDIEEEEGERKLILDTLFTGVTRASSSQEQPQQQPMLQQLLQTPVVQLEQLQPGHHALHFAMAPLAGVNTALAPVVPKPATPPRPVVPPPSHLRMDVATRARVLSKKSVDPQEEEEEPIVSCHRCEAPMRLCVRKLKYPDHVKEYPSFRCTRKGCQTFKSMRVVEQPELERAPRGPRKTRASKKAATASGADADEEKKKRTPGKSKKENGPDSNAAAHLPMANPYAAVAAARRDVADAKAESAPSRKLAREAWFSAARDRMAYVLRNVPQPPPQGEGDGDASTLGGSWILNRAQPRDAYPAPSGTDLAPQLDVKPSRAAAAASATPPERKLEPRKRSRYNTCTQEQKDAVAALLRAHDEELQQLQTQQAGKPHVSAAPLAKRVKTEPSKDHNDAASAASAAEEVQQQPAAAAAAPAASVPPSPSLQLTSLAGCTLASQSTITTTTITTTGLSLTTPEPVSTTVVPASRPVVPAKHGSAKCVLPPPPLPPPITPSPAAAATVQTVQPVQQLQQPRLQIKAEAPPIQAPPPCQATPTQVTPPAQVTPRFFRFKPVQRVDRSPQPPARHAYASPTPPPPPARRLAYVRSPSPIASSSPTLWLSPSPRVDFSSPRFDFSSPRFDFSPQRVDFSPQRVDFSPQRVDFSPQRVDFSPQRVDFSPSPRGVSRAGGVERGGTVERGGMSGAGGGLDHLALTPSDVRAFQMPRMQQMQPMQQMVLQATGGCAPYRALTRFEAEALEQISTAARTLTAINMMATTTMTATRCTATAFATPLFPSFGATASPPPPLQPQPQQASLAHQLQLHFSATATMMMQQQLLQPQMSPVKWYLDEDGEEEEDAKEEQEYYAGLGAEACEVGNEVIVIDDDSEDSNQTGRDDTQSDGFDEYDEGGYDAEFAMELNQHL